MTFATRTIAARGRPLCAILCPPFFLPRATTNVVPFALLADLLICAAAALIERGLGRRGGDQAIASAADQILPPRLFKRLPHFEIILQLEELQQGALQLAITEMLGDRDRLQREWI